MKVSATSAAEGDDVDIVGIMVWSATEGDAACGAEVTVEVSAADAAEATRAGGETLDGKTTGMLACWSLTATTRLRKSFMFVGVA